MASRPPFYRFWATAGPPASTAAAVGEADARLLLPAATSGAPWASHLLDLVGGLYAMTLLYQLLIYEPEFRYIIPC